MRGRRGDRRPAASAGAGPLAVSTGGVLLADRVLRAETFATRLLGRMGRPPLAGGEGLWLTRCGAVHTWFCRGAMDLIFLDGEDRVLRVVTALPPWRLASCRGARQVLELAPGRAAAAVPGQRLEVASRERAQAAPPPPPPGAPAAPSAPTAPVAPPRSLSPHR